MSPQRGVLTVYPYHRWFHKAAWKRWFADVATAKERSTGADVAYYLDTSREDGPSEISFDGELTWRRPTNS